jgi:SAM-dependent methyltransferase
MLSDIFGNLPDGHDIATEYYDQLYPRQGYADKVQEIGERIKGLLGSRQVHILDLCCGTGRAYELFREQIDCKFTGVDIRESMLMKARENYGEAEFVNVDVIRLKEYFKDVKFDCIVALGACLALFDCEQRAAIHRQVCELLIPNGFYVSTTIRDQSMANGYGSKVIFQKAFRHDDYNVTISYHRLYQGPKLPFEQLVYVTKSEIISDGTARTEGKGSVEVGHVPIYNLSSDELINELNYAGFAKVEFIQTPTVPADCVIAWK